MNSKRSMWKLLLGAAAVGLLVTNCTIKTESDDDDTGCTLGQKKNCTACDGGITGYQTCQSDGTYDACYCPGSTNAGSSNGGGSSAGASNSSGGKGGDTSSGGTSAGAAGEGGEGGEGGASIAPIIDPNDCYDCLNKLCTPEWDACVMEDENNPQDPTAPGDYCLSSKGDDTGQIEAVLGCIEAERLKGPVKRDVVRACGASLGQSADPTDNFIWAPNQMTAATAGLINCMADAPDETEPGSWADSKNIPNASAPKPWLDMTCAKLSCTSAQ